MHTVITLELVNSTIVNVSEGIGSIQLCMNVTNGTVEGSINSQIPGVHYYTSSGTATRSSSMLVLFLLFLILFNSYSSLYFMIGYRDFRSTSGFPFFTRGTIPGTTRCIRVTIYDDNLVENDYEYFTFRVQNYRRAVVTQGVTTVNIIDNDGNDASFKGIIANLSSSVFFLYSCNCWDGEQKHDL